MEEILDPFVKNYARAVGPDHILWDNNSRLNQVHILQDCLDQGTIDRIVCPAKSLDHDPFEHVLDICQRTVSACLPAPKTHRELLDALREEWGHLDQQRRTQLIQSIPQ